MASEVKLASLNTSARLPNRFSSLITIWGRRGDEMAGQALQRAREQAGSEDEGDDEVTLSVLSSRAILRASSTLPDRSCVS